MSPTTLPTPIPSFLPGELSLAPGSAGDYRALERFHYRPGRPATWAGVWAVRYAEPASDAPPRVVAVAVLSYPTVHCRARERALGLAGLPPRDQLARVNRHLRTISRVVVHPQFRSLGLATRLVRHVCGQCPTRWVEALAVMGRVHPFFEKGGMTAARSDAPGPTYYWFDRRAAPSRR